MRNIAKLCVICIFIVAVTCFTGCCKRGPTVEEASKAYLAGNYETAAEIFTPKAEEGDPEAQVNIAFMHYCGLHVKQDFAKAALWYRKSAEQNNVTAQYSLGTLYENGEGVETDLAEAWFWYSLAEKQKDEHAARLRKEIEPRIQADKLAETRARLQAWKPR